MTSHDRDRLAQLEKHYQDLKDNAPEKTDWDTWESPFLIRIINELIKEK